MTRSTVTGQRCRLATTRVDLDDTFMPKLNLAEAPQCGGGHSVRLSVFLIVVRRAGTAR